MSVQSCPPNTPLMTAPSPHTHTPTPPRCSAQASLPHWAHDPAGFQSLWWRWRSCTSLSGLPRHKQVPEAPPSCNHPLARLCHGEYCTYSQQVPAKRFRERGGSSMGGDSRSYVQDWEWWAESRDVLFRTVPSHQHDGRSCQVPLEWGERSVLSMQRRYCTIRVHPFPSQPPVLWSTTSCAH